MPLLEYYNGTSWVQAGTVSSVTAGTGLSGGTITSSGTLNIAATGVLIGTYLLPTITVNAQGQITSASSIGTGSANQILKSNGVGVVWASYLSTPSAGSFCLTESNKNFSGVQNTAFGDGALNANTTGFYNTSVGNYALYKTTSGCRNTAVGQAALLNNVAGNSNCAFGESALLWNTGNSNSAFGSNALASNTSGYYNVAVGNESLTRNTTGFRNVALGYSSLFLCSTGNSNTAVGDLSSYGATTGYSNTSVGASSLYTASTGYDNSSFGALSSYFTTSGYRNCAFGRSALYANTTGYQNSAFGFGALSSNTTGNSNVAFGQNALDTNTTGINNTAVGYAADVSASGLTNATAIGAYAVCGASNSIVLGGASSLNSVYYPNVGIGKDTPSYSLHVGNTQQTPISAIGIDNTTNIPAALSTGAVIYASGGDLYAVTSNSGTQKIGTPQNLGTVTSVSISGSTGLTVSGSPITASGTISLTLGSELQGVSSLSSNGVVARTAAGVYTARVITAGTGISITNGNGVSGNPTIALSGASYSGITLTGAVTGSGTSSIATSLAPEQTVTSLAFPSIGTLYVGNNSTNTGLGSGTLNVNLGGSVNNTQINLNFNYANSPAGQFIQYTVNDYAYFKFRYSNLDFWTTDYVSGNPRFKILQKLDVNSKNIINVASPVASTDAATKGYADNLKINNLGINGDVNLSTYNLTTSGSINATTGFSSTPIKVTSNLSISRITLNNTLSTSTANEINFQENGLSKIGFGYNNSSNEGYVWGYDSSAFKIGINNETKFRINTYGGVELPGSSSGGNTLDITRPYHSASQDPAAIYLSASSTSGTFYDALIDPSKFTHFFGQIVFTRGQKASFVLETNAYGEGSSIAMNGDYIQFINPLDDLGIIFTDEDTGNSSSYVSYISSSGSYVTSSSSHKKYSIRKKEHKNYLERINKLNVYSYAYKCDINDSDNSKIKDRKYFKAKRLNVGFLADEVDQVFDNCTDKYKLIDVDEANQKEFEALVKRHSPSIDDKAFMEEKNSNRDGPGIKYDTLLCYTVLALQELSKKVDKYFSEAKNIKFLQKEIE